MNLTALQILICWLLPILRLYLNPSQISIYSIFYFYAKKTARDIRCRPLPTSNLRSDFHRQLLCFAQPRKKSAEKFILDSLPLPLFFQAVHSALQSDIPIGIAIILFVVIVLVKFLGGVLINQLHQPLGPLHLIFLSVLLIFLFIHISL